MRRAQRATSTYPNNADPVSVGNARDGAECLLSGRPAYTADGRWWSNISGRAPRTFRAWHYGQERELYGDQAYWNQDHRLHCQQAGIRYRVNRRPANQYQPLTEYQRTINQARSRQRARGEFAFRIVKRLLGFTMVRYRGLLKNTARVYTLFALANLYLVRRRLLPPGVQFAL